MAKYLSINNVEKIARSFILGQKPDMANKKLLLIITHDLHNIVDQQENNIMPQNSYCKMDVEKSCTHENKFQFMTFG